MDYEDEDSPQTHRHFPLTSSRTQTHNRQGRRGRGRGGSSAFNPSNALGTYEVKCPRLARGEVCGEDEGDEQEQEQEQEKEEEEGDIREGQEQSSAASNRKKSRGGRNSERRKGFQQITSTTTKSKHGRRKKDEQKRNESMMTLEIHSTTSCGRGFSASFAMGDLRGVMLIAGSRKVLGEVVESQEEEEKEEVGLGGRWRREKSRVNSSGDGEDLSSEDDNDNDGEDEKADEDENEDEDDNKVHPPITADTFVPPPPSSHTTPFEKNTFRTPKFWFRYRAHHLPSDSLVPDAPSNMGFIEFDGSACRGFKGVITGPVMMVGENVPFEGWKVKGGSKGVGGGWSWGGEVA